MQNLNLVLVQSDIVWEDVDQNLQNFSKKLEKINSHPDIIILPEMFNTGFTMNVDKCAENENGKSIKWLIENAKEKNCIVAGSLLINDSGKYFNRMFWVSPDGKVETYDKRHLFRMAQEHHTMSQGNSQKIVRLKDWKFNLQICYDLRFPVWSKNNFHDGKYDYDALVYVANWPEVRSHVYKSLLIARALENQCYVIWVNRVGKDGKGIFHSGDSMVVDPYGKIVCQANSNKEELLYGGLNLSLLSEFRAKFQIGLDWDKFNIDT